MKQLITGIMVFFLCGLSVMAQETSDFNPTNPPEPNAAFELTLTSDSADAGSATGGGRYYVGDQVLLTATPTDYHVFVAWVDTSAADSVVSTQPSFYYTIPDRPVHLIARFEYRLMFQLTLELEPANIGAVYGSGYYESQSLAGISVSFSGQYTFKGWWDNDSLVSNQFYFQFQMPERSVHLKALFDYDPTNPSEPDVQASKHRLFLISDPPEACNFNQQQGVMIPENDSIYLYPYQNSGYVFEGWYHKGALYTTAYDIFFTMGVADDTLTARFRYDPASPGEPGKGSAPIYFLSATTQTTTAGSQLAFPVYLCNENLDVTSVVFEVTFPSGVLADYANASLSSRSNGHVLTCDTLGNNAFRFTIANDSLWALTSTSGKLMMIPVTLPSDWKAGSNYPVIFGAAVLGTTSGQLVCPVRNGSVGITPVASSLYASFYTDIHLNRVQFTNMSSGTASTYQWDFGDGQTSTEKNPMHVYAMSGTYSVTLTVSDGANLASVKLDVSIVKEANWTMEGYYTLNKHRTNVKNFTSGLELFSTLSNCSITGNIMIQVEAGETFDLPLDSSVNVLFGRLGEKLLVKGGPQLTFISEKADSTALLSFSGVLNRMYIETILTTAANFRFDDVEMAFSGLKLNVTALNGVNDITTCSGHTTPQVDLSLLGNQFEVHWMLSGEPLNLTGQQNSGSGVIPSMILYSTATYTNRLTYTIQLISNSYIFYEKNINYDIRPSLQVFPKALAPVGNAMLELPQVTFNWQSQDNAAYDLFIWEIGTPEPVVPVVRDIWSAPYTDTHICQYGKAYKWKVLARSSCDSIWSQVDSFHIGLLPDLKVESITLSKTGVYAGEELDVQVLVHNAGGKIFGNYWSDQLYLVSGANLQNRWPVSSTWRWRSLASDSSYQVSFHVTMPLDTVSYTAFLFVADNQYNLAEGNDFNNLKFSEPLSLRHYTIEETDYNSLKLLYEKTNGSGWNNRWTVSSNLLLSRNWPGVGFERGHVTSIDLTQNNLVGQLPAGLFNLPYLRTLILANNNLSGRLDVLADSIKLHGYRCDSLKNINLGYNSFAGEVSSFANLFQGLNQLNLESNRLSEIDTVLSSGISALNLQNQVFTHPDIPLSMIPSLEIPSLFWYRHDTKELKRNDLVFYLMKDGRYLGWIYYNSPSYTLNLYNEWTYAPGDSFNLVQSNSYFYGSKATVHLSFKAGDANIDQQTDILDVQHTLNRIFSDYCYPFNRYAANTYVDDQITVQDIVATVNILLETGVVVDTTQKATLRAAYTGNSLYIANGKLMLDVQVPVSALDISLKSLRDNQVGLLLNSDDFQMIARNTTDGVRFIIYSGDGKEIPAGSTEVAQLASAQAKLMYASLANRQAQAVPVQIANIPTDRPIVDEPLIEAFLNPHSLILRLTQPVEKLTVQIYNMQGILISQQERNQLTAGSHLFDYARTLSSGLYLLKLICNNGETVLTKNYKWIVSK